MTGVRRIALEPDAEGRRLDRWIRENCPGISQSRIEKLCRKGEIRLDGKRVKASARLAAGQALRLPPLPGAGESGASPNAGSREVPPAEARRLRSALIYLDGNYLAINKPCGLAVQGGSRQSRHVDAFARALRFGEAENPRLAHRLDKDTSGVLVMARTARAAREISRIFKGNAAKKSYLAVVSGIPSPREAAIRLPLAPVRSGGFEGIACLDPAEAAGHPEAKSATTFYRVLDNAGLRASLVLLEPATGRKHQLRAHMAAIGNPIVGDGKYGPGGRAVSLGGEFSGRLHLHALCIAFPDPFSNREIRIAAEPSPHLADTAGKLELDLAGPEIRSLRLPREPPRGTGRRAGKGFA